MVVLLNWVGVLLVEMYLFVLNTNNFWIWNMNPVGKLMHIMKDVRIPRTSEDDWQNVCLVDVKGTPKDRTTEYNTSHLKALICILIESGVPHDWKEAKPTSWAAQASMEGTEKAQSPGKQTDQPGRLRVKTALCPPHPQEQKAGIQLLCTKNLASWHDYEIKWSNSTHKTWEATRFVIINT